MNPSSQLLLFGNNHYGYYVPLSPSDIHTMLGILIFMNIVLFISIIEVLYRRFVKKQEFEESFVKELTLDHKYIVVAVLNYFTMVFDVLGIIGVIGYYIGKILF